MSQSRKVMGSDAKLCLEMEGDNGKKQLSFQMRDDGKVEAVEVDGKVEIVGDSATVVDPKDLQVIAIASYTCRKNHTVIHRVISAIKFHTTLGSIYRFIISGEEGGTSEIFLAAVLKTDKEILVLRFQWA